MIIEPETVRVTTAGRRRDLYFPDPEALQVHVDAILVELGCRSFSLTRDNVRQLEGVEVRVRRARPGEIGNKLTSPR